MLKRSRRRAFPGCVESASGLRTTIARHKFLSFIRLVEKPSNQKIHSIPARSNQLSLKFMQSSQ